MSESIHDALHDTSIDPVCGMKVVAGTNAITSVHNGKSYHFCAEGCRVAFEKKPGKYLKKKGWFGRFLDRMGKANDEQFGKSGPTCCG